MIQKMAQKTVMLDPKTVGPAVFYKLMIGGIIPRPIAWVASANKAGVTNLAPFSFYNGVSSNPPAIMFAVTNRPDGTHKDTLKNILDTKEFVVNSVSEDQAEVMNQTSGDYPEGVSEFEKAGVKSVKSTIVKVPGVEGAMLRFECRLHGTYRVGEGAGAATIVIGEILMGHVAEQAWQNEHVLADVMKPVARLGGPNYTKLGEIFSLKRPRV